MPRRKAGCSRASAFGKLGAQRAPNLCVVQMRCRVSGDLPIQASGGLGGFPGEVAHQDDGCLGPGAGSFGTEGGFGYAATPVDFLNHSGSRAEATRIRNYLGSLRFTTLEMEHPISQLSGGQKAKIFFLHMILEESNVLLLDEPTRNFSPLSGPVIREILSAFGGAILSVSHDRLYLEEVCQTIYALTPQGLERVWHK